MYGKWLFFVQFVCLEGCVVNQPRQNLDIHMSDTLMPVTSLDCQTCYTHTYAVLLYVLWILCFSNFVENKLRKWRKQSICVVKIFYFMLWKSKNKKITKKKNEEESHMVNDCCAYNVYVLKVVLLTLPDIRCTYIVLCYVLRRLFFLIY